MGLREGQAFVRGTDAATARDLLAKAAKAGLPASVVRLDSDGGFVVPAELVEPPKKPTRKSKTKGGS